MTLAFRYFAARDVIAKLLEAGFESAWEPPPRPELGVPAIPNPGVFLARKS